MGRPRRARPARAPRRCMTAFRKRRSASGRRSATILSASVRASSEGPSKPPAAPPFRVRSAPHRAPSPGSTCARGPVHAAAADGWRRRVPGRRQMSDSTAVAAFVDGRWERWCTAVGSARTKPAGAVRARPHPRPSGAPAQLGERLAHRQPFVPTPPSGLLLAGGRRTEAARPVDQFALACARAVTNGSRSRLWTPRDCSWRWSPTTSSVSSDASCCRGPVAS
jgi:hypothetical protein